jgi:D-alanyl-D-alanine carboxypeptidase
MTLLLTGVLVLGVVCLGLLSYIVYLKLTPQEYLESVVAHSPVIPVVPTKPAYKLSSLQKMYSKLLETEKIIGEGVYVVAWDKQSNKFYDMYGKNIDAPFNAASVTKLMTALTLADEGMLSGNLITGSDQSGEPAGLPEGEASGDFRGQTFPQADLVAAMLIQSSNQAAYSLAKPIGMDEFIEKMNKEARKLGMSRTVLRDPSGYDFGRKNKASYMSPRDVARVSFRLINEYPELIKLTAHDTFDIANVRGRKFTLRNTNPLVKDTGNVILSKTGYTNLAGGNLAMVTEPREGILVAYVSMKSTREGRFTDMESMVQSMHTTFEMYDAMKGEID